MKKKYAIQILTLTLLFLLVVISIVGCWGTNDPEPAGLAPENDSVAKNSDTSNEPRIENLASSLSDVSTSSVSPTATTIQTPIPLSIDGVYQKLKRSTVFIYATEKGGASTGTGFVYSKNGLVATNAHVVQKATSIRVYPEGTNESIPATIVGISYCDDLAVLQIEGNDLQPALFGNSDDLKLGEEVVALGYPLSRELGIDLTVTSGQVNRLNARMENLENAIQTDAPINPGNSGGPLVNMYGEVIGINTTRINATNEGQRVNGVSFSIASNFAIPILSQLETGKSLYKTGLDMQFDDKTKNAVVTSVAAGSPAEGIGIKDGDVLISIHNEKFQSWYDACRLMKDAQYEETGVQFEIMRGQSKLVGEMGNKTSDLFAPPFVQKVNRSSDVLPEQIATEARKGFQITDISYDRTNKEWVTIYSQNAGFNEQKQRIVDDYKEIEKAHKSDMEDGFYITDLAFGGGKWVAVFSKGTSFIEQEIIYERGLSEDQVNQWQEKGYAITSAASDSESLLVGPGLGTPWLVTLSKGGDFSSLTSQLVDSEELSDRLSTLGSEGQTISLLAPSSGWLKDTWLVVSTKLQTHSRQRQLVTPNISENVLDTIATGNAPTIDAMKFLNDEWIIIHR